MARIELPKGIAAIHGRMGDFVFRTYANGKTYVHYQPKKSDISRKRLDNGR